MVRVALASRPALADRVRRPVPVRRMDNIKFNWHFLRVQMAEDDTKLIEHLAANSAQ